MADLNVQTQPDPSGDPDLRVVASTDEDPKKQSRKSELYRSMRKRFILRTLFIAAIAGLIWLFIMVFFVDGLFNDAFPQFFVWLLGLFHVSKMHATTIYWNVIGNRKGLITLVFFMIIFLVILWTAMAELFKSIDRMGKRLDDLTAGEFYPIRLDKDLRPMEEKMNLLQKKMKEQQEETERIEEEAAQIEKKRNDLVLFLAHDLKTPLTSVIAYLSTLNENPQLPEEERIKYTNVALQKSHRLQDLIQEFFEITRFNLNGIVLEKTVFDLSMMLEQLADEMYAVLQEHDMCCEVYTDEQVIIDGDPDKLARVFDNLLRNAVNYSYPGTTIRIVAREVGEWIEIVFANKGNRIPESKLNSIFEKFYRADEARSSDTGGAGLGLAIAKEIVELHDGMIRATSDEEETRFIVVLPEKTEEEREQKKERLKKRIEEAIKEEKIKV